MAWKASSVEMELTQRTILAVRHGVLHFAEHGEGDFRGQVHQDQVGGALRHLFHQAATVPQVGSSSKPSTWRRTDSRPFARWVRRYKEESASYSSFPFRAG